MTKMVHFLTSIGDSIYIVGVLSKERHLFQNHLDLLLFSESLTLSLLGEITEEWLSDVINDVTIIGRTFLDMF